MKRPAPGIESDAGVREASATRVACGRNAQMSCHFFGRVRSLRAEVLEPAAPPLGQTYFPERATEVILGDVPRLECANMQIGGIRLGYDGSSGHERRDGPMFDFTGEVPVAREIMITLTPGTPLPFAEGEVICGSVMVVVTGDTLTREVFIARPNGDVLLARGKLMPRDPSPAPGWTFTLGPRRTSRPPVKYHDMVVTHGGVSVQTAFSREPARLRAPDGEFLMGAAL